MRKITITLITIFCLALALAGTAAAKTFPSKDLKIIVPFSPGGGVDTTCRMIAEVAPKYLDGRKIIIENMPGGGAVIGQTFVAKAKPDGYTLLGYTSSVVSNPMTKKTTYTYESFRPVAMYCFDPEILIVPANSPYKTLKEFIDAAKSNEISLATPGFSTSHHIAGLIMENKLGVKFGYIHNQGASMQLQQLLGGHVDAGMLAMGETVSYIKDGSLRALAVALPERNAFIPDVPTFKENDVDLEWGAFRGLAVPSGTPDEVVSKLGEFFKNIIMDPEFAARMQKAGFPLVYRNGSDFENYVGGVADSLKTVIPTLNK